MPLASRSIVATALAILIFDALYASVLTALSASRSPDANEMRFEWLTVFLWGTILIPVYVIPLWLTVIFPLFRSCRRPGKSCRMMIPVLSFLGCVAGFGISLLGNASGFLSSVQAISLMAAFGAIIAQADVIIDRALPRSST